MQTSFNRRFEIRSASFLSKFSSYLGSENLIFNFLNQEQQIYFYLEHPVIFPEALIHKTPSLIEVSTRLH